jgi:hypothetical protein
MSCRRRKPGRTSSAWIRPAKRHAIYERDGLVCVWCGHVPDDFTLDHLFPRGSRFRDNDPRRLVTSCRTCNLSRKSMSVATWLRHIRAQGYDLAPVMRRLRVVRHVPINRAAGRRGLLAYRARMNPPMLPLPDDFVGAVGGVPF